VLAIGAACGSVMSTERWDWQPALALVEPWRVWTAAFVHWSPRHLVANLLGLALVATLGVAAACGTRATLAWCLAWPLTHLGLALQPELQHYGGLSGVLHAGVAVAALQLLTDAGASRRRIGGLLLAGLAIKLGIEAPWGPALRQLPGWDIAIAPLAHATGSIAGLACAALLLARGAVSDRQRAGAGPRP
jgi:rhomboid family GlyGly-CTERM serine protease